MDSCKGRCRFVNVLILWDYWLWLNIMVDIAVGPTRPKYIPQSYGLFRWDNEFSICSKEMSHTKSKDCRVESVSVSGINSYVRPQTGYSSGLPSPLASKNQLTASTFLVLAQGTNTNCILCFALICKGSTPSKSTILYTFGTRGVGRTLPREVPPRLN